MHSTILSQLVLLLHISRASKVVVCSVSSADMKRRKRGRKNTCTNRCVIVFQGSMGNLIQSTHSGGNRLVLTKEFNLAIIDSDNQICPWPVDFIFLSYSYLLTSNADFRLGLHCLWQLNLTGGNRHDGKGSLSQTILCAGSFPWQVFFPPLLKLYVSLSGVTCLRVSRPSHL